MNSSRSYHGYSAYHREPGGLRRLDFFVDRIELWREMRQPSQIRILDIGCGNGNIALPLASLGYQVIGIDGDSVSIFAARERAKDLQLSTIEFRIGWMQDIGTEKFDVVICSEVLEHQKNPNEFLDELKKVLNIDGIILFSIPNGKTMEEKIRWCTTHTRIGNRVKRFLKKRIRHETIQSQTDHPHEQFFSLDSVRSIFQSHNIEICEGIGASAAYKEFFYLGGRFFIKRGSMLFRFFNGLDATWASSIRLEQAGGWLFECRITDMSQPLCIHIVPTLNVGGAEKVVCDLAHQLPRHGFRVCVIAIIAGGTLEKEFWLKKIPFRILQATGLGGWRSIPELIRMFRVRNPSIVHTHLFGADMCGRIAAFFAGVRVRIMTEHNVDRGKSILHILIKKILSYSTTHFVAVSCEVKKHMSMTERISLNRISVISNGINMKCVIPRVEEAFASPIRFLFVGRLTFQKGVDILLKALGAGSMLEVYPWHLFIAGIGEDELALKEMAEKLGISARIHWLGFCEDIPQLMSRSDIFIFPSRYEGLGNAFIEAAAAGIPIIASNLPVFHEIVQNDEVEFFSVNDSEDLLRAIQYACSHPAEVIERAGKIRARILQKFSVEAMTEKYAALYRSLL